MNYLQLWRDQCDVFESHKPEEITLHHKNQNGFRKRRSSTDQICTLGRILYSVRAKNLNAVMIFVDVSNAFHCFSVQREAMAEY